MIPVLEFCGTFISSVDASYSTAYVYGQDGQRSNKYTQSSEQGLSMKEKYSKVTLWWKGYYLNK